MANDIWNQVKEKLKEKVLAPSYETWLAKLSVEIIGNDMFVTAESEFNRDWVEARYKDLIASIALELTGQSYNVKILPTVIQPHGR